MGCPKRGIYMFYCDCNFSSYVSVESKYSNIYPPVLYLSDLYIINENLFHLILTKLGYYQHFIQYIRTHGCAGFKNWLILKNLLNSEFLESVSKYIIKNTHLKKINKYNEFVKNENNMLFSSDYWQNLFKRSFLYVYLKDNKKLFNLFVSKELDKIDAEMKNNFVFNWDCFSQSAFNTNIFEYLIDTFVQKYEICLISDYLYLNNLDISLDCALTTDCISVKKIAYFYENSNSKLALKNKTLNECIDKDTKIRLKFNMFSCKKLDIFYEYMKELTQDKLLFDLNYINQMCHKKSDVLVGQNLDQDLMIQQEKQVDYFKIEKCFDIKNIQYNFILNKYKKLSESNIIIDSEANINKVIAVLNLNDSNLSRINQLLSKKTFDTSILKVCYIDKLPVYAPVGYARLLV